MKRLWKYTVGLLVISYWLLVQPAQAFPEIKPGFPRLANYFLHWTISENEARELSKYDLVILDAEVQERSRSQIELLRKLNPKIILLAYVPASEIRRDVASLGQIAPLRYKLGADIPDDWYLKDAAGSRLSFWPGTWIINIVQSEALYRWDEYLPQFVTREILSTDFWDGVFYDNAWDDVVHFAGNIPDLDRDGRVDDPSAARAKWQDGLRKIYTRTADLNPDKFVFENDGPIYAPYVHGVLLENFPRKKWARHLEELEQISREAKDPAVAILNANTLNTGQRDDWRAMRFGLATALISDAFYSFDFGDQDHGQVWQYDEYGVFLGEAIGEARPLPSTPPGRGAWQREFEQGIVFVNPGEQPRTFELAAEVETLRGTQDPLVNDGSITRQLTIGARDGFVVLRPLESIIGAAYENGIFARVFDNRGESIRAGFFAFDRQEQSGAIIARIDLDGDGNIEKIKKEQKGNAAVIRVKFGDNHYGDPISVNTEIGSPSIAIGDLAGDGVKEIVVGEKGQVRVYRPNGALAVLPFYPFGIKYKGGINVAIGDLNNDGFSEIVTGAGAGGGPQVRIFNRDGRLLSGGFFAYDPRFRGGVRVAVGDIDGDGNAEIVTGPGAGGGPQVRIFDDKGKPLSSGFFAFDRASRAGVIPIVADINNDNKKEILAITK